MSGRLYVISGNDDFSVKEYAKKIIVSLCGTDAEENEALEIIHGDSDTESAVQILDSLINAVTTPPFLTPEKIIWLKHFDKYDDAFSESTAKKKKGRLDVLEKLFKEGIMDGITVVIDGCGLDKKRTFCKTCLAVCEKSGELKLFEKPDPKSKNFSANMFRTVQELFTEEGRKVSPDAATFLAESSGGDLVRLKNEIVKLISYVGEDREIMLADCNAVCSMTPDVISWEFSSALVDRNPEKALELLPRIAELLQQSTPSSNPYMAIVGSVAGEFNRLLAVKCEAAKCGIRSNARYPDFMDLSARLKEEGRKSIFSTMHPFRAFKLWESSSRFTPAELADAFDAIAETNLGVVTGGDGSILLEMLALRIAGKR